MLRREPGWEKVAAFGLACELSVVNYVEVADQLTMHGMPQESIEPLVRSMVGAVVPFDEAQAVATARIRASARPHELSLADCACLALATLRQATVITADRKWAALKLKLKIVQIRERS